MAAVSGNEVKVSLKIVIDMKARKVVFAEAKKEFVDILLHMLSLPLSTVAKLLNSKGMVGCLGSLYKSIESLDSEYFEPNLSKHSVLNSKMPVIVPLLSVNDEPSNITLYTCHVHQTTTSEPSTDCCARGRSAHNFTVKGTSRNAGFVKSAVAYMVMDDLEVKPLSITLIKNHISDFDYVEEMQVEVGVKEGLAMLKASLETKAVLTTVFLGKN